jgi:PAS domain S-box-containing protein
MKKLLNYLRDIWTLSIRRQLMFGIIVVHAGLMSVFVFDMVNRQSVFLHSQSIDQAISLAATLSANSISWVLANDIVGLEEILSAQSSYPSLEYAMVLRPDGRVLAHTQKDKVGLYLSDEVSHQLFVPSKDKIVLVNNEQTIDVASPIYSSGKFLGWARVNLAQNLNTENLRVIYRNGIIYTLLAIGIGALFAFFMGRGITRGLMHIVKVADAIKQGDHSLRATITRRDEIGQLGEDLNLMLDTIDKNKRDIQAIIDNSPAIVFVQDTDCHFTFTNRQFQNVYKISSRELIGKTVHDVFEPKIADKMLLDHQTVLSNGESIRQETVMNLQDGIHTYTSVHFPLFDDHNHIYAACVIANDISERIEMEKEKLSLEGQLFYGQKMQAIGQLTGGIAHDFNNILQIISGFISLSEDVSGEGGNEKLSKYLEQIRLASGRAEQLVAQMLAYSQKVKLDVSYQPLRPLVDNVLQLLRPIFPSTLMITTTFDEEPLLAEVDPVQFEQMLLNLCINARDAMAGHGTINIKLAAAHIDRQICSACQSTVSGAFMCLSVSDSGTGITDEVRSRIFDPFYTTKGVGEGSGLGLSMIHGIVHSCDGHILLSSVLGEGSAFRLLFPAVSRDVMQVSVKKIRNESHTLDRNSKSGVIMVVDDEAMVANVLAENLEKHGYEVALHTSSESALDVFRSAPDKFVLVITDQTMPNLTGIKLAEAILEVRAGIPVILLTGYSKEVSEELALQAGITAYFQKPVDVNVLLRTVDELLETDNL